MHIFFNASCFLAKPWCTVACILRCLQRMVCSLWRETRPPMMLPSIDVASTRTQCIVLNIRAKCAVVGEDGDVDPPYWLDQKLGKKWKKWIVSKYICITVKHACKVWVQLFFNQAGGFSYLSLSTWKFTVLSSLWSPVLAIFLVATKLIKG